MMMRWRGCHLKETCLPPTLPAQPAQQMPHSLKRNVQKEKQINKNVLSERGERQKDRRLEMEMRRWGVPSHPIKSMGKETKTAAPKSLERGTWHRAGNDAPAPAKGKSLGERRGWEGEGGKGKGFQIGGRKQKNPPQNRPNNQSKGKARQAKGQQVCSSPPKKAKSLI